MNLIVVRQENRMPLHVMVIDHLEVGRDCDGLLLVDQQVSRRHLQLDMVEGRMVVADLGSTNGTFLDGMRIRSPVVLEPYSKITLGNTSIRLYHHDDDAPERVDGGAGSELSTETDGEQLPTDRVSDLRPVGLTAVNAAGEQPYPVPAFLTPIRH